MTEAEWLACTDPIPMLEFLEWVASDRKPRLFGAACCRASWSLMLEPEIRRAVELSEAFVDDAEVWHALEEAVQQVEDINMEVFEIGWGGGATTPGLWYRTAAVVEATRHPVRVKFIPAKLALAAEEMAAEYPLQGEDIRLVHEIFGNPFRLAPLDSAWMTPTAVALSQKVYDSLDFSLLPIVADALEEAGCNDTDLLDHCRQPGPHARGCWVVDLLTGKE